MVHNKRTFFLKVCLFVKEKVYNNKSFVHIKHIVGTKYCVHNKRMFIISDPDCNWNTLIIGQEIVKRVVSY